MNTQRGRLRRFLFARATGVLLVLHGIVLTGCVVGVTLIGFYGPQAR